MTPEEAVKLLSSGRVTLENEFVSIEGQVLQGFNFVRDRHVPEQGGFCRGATMYIHGVKMLVESVRVK